MVCERRRTPRFPAGDPGQSVRFHCRSAVCGGAVRSRMESRMTLRRCQRVGTRGTKPPRVTRNTRRRIWRVGKWTRSACLKFTRSVPLFSNQNGDRSRPTLFPGPCPLVPLQEIVSQCFPKTNSITVVVACTPLAVSPCVCGILRSSTLQRSEPMSPVLRASNWPTEKVKM